MQAEQNSTPPLSHHRATFCCHAGFGGNGFVNKIGEDLFLFLAHLHNHSEELFLNGLDAFRVIFQESLTKPQKQHRKQSHDEQVSGAKEMLAAALSRKQRSDKKTGSKQAN